MYNVEGAQGRQLSCKYFVDCKVLCIYEGSNCYHDALCPQIPFSVMPSKPFSLSVQSYILSSRLSATPLSTTKPLLVLGIPVCGAKRNLSSPFLTAQYIVATLATQWINTGAESPAPFLLVCIHVRFPSRSQKGKKKSTTLRHLKDTYQCHLSIGQLKKPNPLKRKVAFLSSGELVTDLGPYPGSSTSCPPKPLPCTFAELRTDRWWMELCILLN